MPEQYSNPAYLAYILMAWQQSYGNLYVDLGEIFQGPMRVAFRPTSMGKPRVRSSTTTSPAPRHRQEGALEGLMARTTVLPCRAGQRPLPMGAGSPVQMYYREDEQVFYDNAWSPRRG